jgi:hypothetical protein
MDLRWHDDDYGAWKIDVWAADRAAFASSREFAQRIAARLPCFDIPPPRRVDAVDPLPLASAEQLRHAFANGTSQPCVKITCSSRPYQ